MPTNNSNRRQDEDDPLDPEFMAMIKDEQTYSESTGNRFRRVKVNQGESWVIRFLPVALGPKGTPFARIAKHWVNGKPFFCKKHTHPAFGGNPDYACPVCAVVDRFRENKDEEIAAAARKAKADPVWLWYCAVKEIEKGSSTEVKPRSEQVQAYEVTFYKTLANELLIKYQNGAKRQRDSFAHLTRGNDFVLARGKKNLSLDKQEAGPIFTTSNGDPLPAEKLRAMTDAILADAEGQFKEPTFLSREKYQMMADKLEEQLAGGRRRSRNDDFADDDDPKPRRRQDDDDDRPARSSTRRPPVDDDDAPRGRRSRNDDPADDDDKPRGRRAPVEDDDDKPRRRAPVDDDDDKPRGRRAPVDDDDDKPRRRVPADDDDDSPPPARERRNPTRSAPQDADDDDGPPPPARRPKPRPVTDDDDDDIPMGDNPKRRTPVPDADEGSEDDDRPKARTKPQGPPPGTDEADDDDEDNTPHENDDPIKPASKTPDDDDDAPPAVAPGRGKGASGTKLGGKIRDAVRNVNDRE